MSERERVLQKQIEHLMAMLEISRILNSTLDLEHLLRIIVNSAERLTDCDASSIILVDPKSGALYFRASSSLQDYKVRPLVVPMDSSVAGWIVRHNKPVIIDDAQNDPRFFNQVDKVSGTATRSILGVPMVFQERIIGVLEAVNKRDGRFTQEDTERLTILAAQAAVAIENANMLAELQRAYEELSQLDRLKSEFITTTSHELRTPLTAIKGYLRLITSGMMKPEQQKEALQTISRHVDTIVHLVNDLLFAQEMDAIEFKFGDVDLVAILQAEIDQARSRAEPTGIHLVPDMAPDVGKVWGDAEHLQLVVHNLLDNAIKFSPDGGDITLHLYPHADRICLEVSDPGIGIPPDKLDKIFERFYRIEEPGGPLFGGLGLGLAVAKHIVEAHRGSIDVVSTPGQGSRFTITLPTQSPYS